MEDILFQEPEYRRFPGSKRIVIFIHGIVEGPEQFRNLAWIAYNKGYSTYCLLLPGHGGNSSRFTNTPTMRWVSYVSAQIRKMSYFYKEIILVGHSMGALLCIDEVASNHYRIKKLVLIDVPLKIHLWPRVLKSAWKIIRRDIEPQDGYTVAQYRAMGVHVQPNEQVGWMKWLQKYIEVYILIRYTRKRLMKIKVPILAIFAEKDEFVSRKAKKELRRLDIPTKQLSLEDSGHFCYHESDLLLLEKSFGQFLDE